MKIRDRIVELRRVPARDLLPNPRNWRTHPKAQQDALRGILAEVGYASAILVRETPAGLQIIDGHLRAETSPDSEVPCLVLDVTEAEADKLLATFDPLGDMAGTDPAKLNELLHDIETGSEALAKMLDEVAKEAGIVPGDGGAADDADAVDIPDVFQVAVVCEDEADQKEFYDRMREEGRKCRVLTV